MYRRALVLATGVATSACFPTFQGARIEPGLRLDAAITVLADQRRHDAPQGTDVISYLTPAYGFGHRFEIGVPVGIYAENGLFNSGPLNGDRNSIIAMPYLKLGLLGSDSPHHLAIIAQASLVLPANVGLRYGRDLGTWEPHVGFNYIFSGGQAGDDPTITRYQEKDQTMVAISAGATLNRARRVAVELGMLRNRYSDVVGFNSSGEIIQVRTFYDLYVGMRLNLLRTR